MIALLENFQDEGGSVSVPRALWEFGAPERLGGVKSSPRRGYDPRRRGAGAVERGGLENRWACKRLVGSNPTPAAEPAGTGRFLLRWMAIVPATEELPFAVPRRMPRWRAPALRGSQHGEW